MLNLPSNWVNLKISPTRLKNAYAKSEASFRQEYLAEFLDSENLWISQPDNGEQALEIVETLVRSNAVDLIVVDSVAALVPQAEIDGDMGDSHMGLQARLMSQALRKLAGVLHKMNTTVIFINQIRQKIGGMSYGNNETTTGGNALKFYASVRVDIRKIQSLKQGEDVIGNRVKAKVIKNKVAPPFRQAEFDIMFGEGISRTGEIVDYGVKLDVIDKAGAWFSYKSTKIGQGRENAKIFLKENSAVCQEIENEIRNSIGLEGDLPSLSDDISTGDDE
jgi:recombination protein RecA